MLNKTAQNIKNRLSLREPQAKSLEILATLADTLPLNNVADITNERDAVRALHPTTFSDFERDFPSVTFSLATGVGKTRLMGAFIAYLYAEKGIKNFFVIAPGNTIYNKLIGDFGNPSSPKYVFRGISEFAIIPPKIITGENFNNSLTGNIFGETIRINIFNIQKISSEILG
jgi:type III restriction enzyme